MTRSQPLLYLQTMFATCMVFQAVYFACVALWVVAPELNGHAMLTVIFPQFKLLDAPSFVYGLIASGMYGWFVSAVFVFFYNLWPTVAALISGRKTAPQ